MFFQQQCLCACPLRSDVNIAAEPGKIKSIKSVFQQFCGKVFQRCVTAFNILHHSSKFTSSELSPEFKISSTRPLLLDPPSMLLKPRPCSLFKLLFHSDWAQWVTPIHQVASISLASASNGKIYWPNFTNCEISVAYWWTSQHFEVRARRLMWSIGWTDDRKTHMIQTFHENPGKCS